MQETANENKNSAMAFQQLVVDGKVKEAYEKYIAPNMRHHNPWFAGDAQSLQKGMEESHLEYPHKIFEVQRAIAEGDFVAVHSWVRMKPEDRGVALIHIFQFEDGRIIDMWEVGQAVPENSPNERGMF